MTLIKKSKFANMILLVVLLFIFSQYVDKDKSVPKEKAELVDLVYPLLDTENSRWFFFSSASRPFGMMNLSPDNQIGGAWGSGYRYNTDTIKGFSHIHAWQMAGISVMPVLIPEENPLSIFTDFYSKFSHDKEKITPGYHYLELDRYGISAELTSTNRTGFHQYRYPEGGKTAILFNLNTMLGPCDNSNGKLEQNDEMELSGSVVMEATSRRPKQLTVFFKVKLNTKIAAVEKDIETGNYLVSLENPKEKVLMKLSISYTSIENAEHNMETELPQWDFEEIVADSRAVWNSLLGRIEIEGGSYDDRRRFYTDLWHALQGRRIISDVSGAYPDQTSEKFRIGQLPLDANGHPKFNHYNSDSFWGAQWTLNTLWGLVYPEIMEEFVFSLIQYYKDGGLIPRGPSGGNYTYVMTGASSTPFIVSAIQKGIITEDLDEIYKALKKNHMHGGIMEKSGYEHTTQLGGGLRYYMQNGYVPYPIPEGKFGLHQDGASLTMEYAYQDWTLSQLAKKLDYEEDYQYFLKRSKNYVNVFDKVENWMRPKNVEGKWKENFDPYQKENGFIESNAAQSTWFVPHDLDGLAQLMGGKEKAIQKLNKQFEEAEKLSFAAGTSHALESHPENSRVPINFGNQPSIQTSFIFNQLGRPDLTQFWTRKVITKTFSGITPAVGYNGDEDQGLMGSLNVLIKMGLFQMNGGTEENPVYQIGSPLFKKITIHLNSDYFKGGQFEIEANNNSQENIYINNAEFNDLPIKNYEISHKEITNGGTLNLEMKNTPVKVTN